MGKTTLCNAIMGISPPRAEGSIRFQGDELVGVASHKIARRGIGYVPAGAAPLSVAHGRPAPADRRSRRVERRKRVDARARLRALPAARRAQDERRRAALRRRAADARDRSCARHEPHDPGHGRAVRRPRAGRHREPDRDVQAPRGGGPRDPAHRAEPRRRDRARRAPARHDRRDASRPRRRRRSSRGDPELQRRYLGVEPLAH